MCVCPCAVINLTFLGCFCYSVMANCLLFPLRLLFYCGPPLLSLVLALPLAGMSVFDFMCFYTIRHITVVLCLSLAVSAETRSSSHPWAVVDVAVSSTGGRKY